MCWIIFETEIIGGKFGGGRVVVVYLFCGGDTLAYFYLFFWLLFLMGRFSFLFFFF